MFDMNSESIGSNNGAIVSNNTPLGNLQETSVTPEQKQNNAIESNTNVSNKKNENNCKMQEQNEDPEIRFNAQLREKMLQFWFAVQGHEVEIRLYDG
jgi:hypothetical protein